MVVNRLRFVVVVMIVLAAIGLAGLTVSGSFNAKFDIERTASGPASLSVAGALGPQTKAPPPPPPSMPEPVAATSEGKWPVTVTPPPYDGPTSEERAALAQLRAALTIAHGRQCRALPPDARALCPPVPEIRLPARPLTRFEIDELRRKAAELRS